jgi:serine/threonine protein phosphatase PrpC
LLLRTIQEVGVGDDFMVLGSDGLYDVLSNQEICGMCYELQNSPAQVIADHLVATALHRGSMVRTASRALIV